MRAELRWCSQEREEGCVGGCIGVAEREGERREFIGLGHLECG